MNSVQGGWIWVLGEQSGLRWVVEHQRMAFSAAGAARSVSLDVGDLAILYVSRGAFHNPTRDVARLGGVAEVVGSLQQKSVEIAGRSFTHQVDIRFEVLFEERSGPPVKPVAADLHFVRNVSAWGTYFRTSPLKVSEHDFALMRAAIDRWTREHPTQ